MQLKKAYKVGRNAPCYCGSGAKYKKCCLIAEEEQVSKQLDAMRMVEKEQEVKEEKSEEAEI